MGERGEDGGGWGGELPWLLSVELGGLDRIWRGREEEEVFVKTVGPLLWWGNFLGMPPPAVRPVDDMVALSYTCDIIYNIAIT